MLILVPNLKESAGLLSSDFRSENPLTQTRTFHTLIRYKQAKKTHMKKIYLICLLIFVTSCNSLYRVKSVKYIDDFDNTREINLPEIENKNPIAK